MAEAASYLYAVGRGLDPTRLEEVPGLRGSVLRLVRYRGLDAIVSSVDLDEFGEEPLRHHFEDLDWLEQTARAHDAVVRTLWAAAAALAPVRLATICRSDDAVRRRLDRWYDDLVRALDRVEGRREWSVKAFLRATSPQPIPDDASAEPISGTTYLMRRKAEMRAEERASVDAAVLVEEIHRLLGASAIACRRLPPQDRRLTGETEPMVLNGAYLVDDAEGDTFCAFVEQLAARQPSLRLTVNGPWPPYSFATLETS